MTSELFYKTINEEFKELADHYFNAAYFGPSPKRAQEKITQIQKRIANPSFIPYEEWIPTPDRVRKKFAQLLNVSADCIFHSSATCDVIKTITHTIELEKNDCVVSLNGEYPSNVLPWLFAEKMGQFKFKQLEAPILPDQKWLERNLPKNTKIFNLSHVSFNTGRKVNLIEIGRYLESQDILFIVDGTQSFGGLELRAEELQYIHAASFSTYKWLLGPYGHAFGYLSKKMLKKLKNYSASWINNPNFQDSYQFKDFTTEVLPGARQYDRGQSPNLLTMAGLEGSLDLFLELGIKNIQSHNQTLTQHFLDNFHSNDLEIITPAEDTGNIICLKLKNHDINLQKKLKDRGIDVSIRGGNLRISFHLYNTLTEVNNLLNFFK